MGVFIEFAPRAPAVACREGGRSWAGQKASEDPATLRFSGRVAVALFRFFHSVCVFPESGGGLLNVPSA